ncbi:MAG TPA: methylmalonyl Co-A mutase-associated GTPase MeaB [Verrucomicrobiae bacterium]|nr:methylmalonyl Co-A mutase-associated GTPase MeaB [Verrucomicrobiae bacterium]
MEQLLEKIFAGNRRAIARAITLVENRDPARYQLLAGLNYADIKAHVIGITGSPGAGKSSLVDRLTVEYRELGLKVGIIAVDPSSPFSGGALLGDRIRMQQHATDPEVFIRSMGSRGNLGGLAPATGEAVRVLAAGGKDIILIETVGVGQSEMEIMKLADTTVVILTPGAGDSIQTIKAGIMEIADVFAINKADLPGAKRLAREVRAMLHINCSNLPWCPPVLETVSVTGDGIKELAETIKKHREHMMQSGELQERRHRRAGDETVETILAVMREWLNGGTQRGGYIREVMAGLRAGAFTPYDAAMVILKEIFGGGFNTKEEELPWQR